ncbi:MAG: allophanate hydrolase [Candidatus Thiodiazotropha sp.]
MSIDSTQSFAVEALLQGYREGQFTPAEVVDEALTRIEAVTDNPIWISRLEREKLQAYVDALQGASPETHPLYGIPFAIKDNIDLAGLPTTAACPDYAYLPEESAFVVQCLIDAGAIPLGKTNLDQFATGLVGVRSPYGVCHNSFNSEFIAGGSSSGSAVAVALGQVSFALGTDTAGSGRVPAAFNNLLGLKPTRGLLSTRGVVPACRTLDVVSIFALDSRDASRVFQVAAAYDEADSYARPMQPPLLGRGISEAGFRFGVPRDSQLEFFGDSGAERLFRGAIEGLKSLGGVPVEIDFSPFLESARLLYEGPWVAERYLAAATVLKDKPEALLEVTRKIISGGAEGSAAEAFAAQYRLADLRRSSEKIWDEVAFIITPTAGTIYRIDQLEADPIQLNSNLGTYTNFMNLLDLAAIALPAGFRDDGLPNGVTLFAPAFYDQALLGAASRLHAQLGATLGATSQPLEKRSLATGNRTGYLPVAVCGAHMQGLPLNIQLLERGGRLLRKTTTASAYQLYLLPGGPPYRPGLVRSNEGSAVELEVWELPVVNLGDFLNQIPAPLGLGRLELADGSWVIGFLCESHILGESREITRYGGWRRFWAEGGPDALTA